MQRRNIKMTSKKVIIIGAGPAGLTAAYELLKDKEGYTKILSVPADK